MGRKREEEEEEEEEEGKSEGRRKERGRIREREESHGRVGIRLSNHPNTVGTVPNTGPSTPLSDPPSSEMQSILFFVPN